MSGGKVSRNLSKDFIFTQVARAVMLPSGDDGMEDLDFTPFHGAEVWSIVVWEKWRSQGDEPTCSQAGMQVEIVGATNDDSSVDRAFSQLLAKFPTETLPEVLVCLRGVVRRAPYAVDGDDCQSNVFLLQTVEDTPDWRKCSAHWQSLVRLPEENAWTTKGEQDEEEEDDDEEGRRADDESVLARSPDQSYLRWKQLEVRFDLMAPMLAKTLVEAWKDRVVRITDVRTEIEWTRDARGVVGPSKMKLWLTVKDFEPVGEAVFIKYSDALVRDAVARLVALTQWIPAVTWKSGVVVPESQRGPNDPLVVCYNFTREPRRPGDDDGGKKRPRSAAVQSGVSKGFPDNGIWTTNH